MRPVSKLRLLSCARTHRQRRDNSTNHETMGGDIRYMVVLLNRNNDCIFFLVDSIGFSKCGRSCYVKPRACRLAACGYFCGGGSVCPKKSRVEKFVSFRPIRSLSSNVFIGDYLFVRVLGVATPRGTRSLTNALSWTKIIQIYETFLFWAAPLPHSPRIHGSVDPSWYSSVRLGFGSPQNSKFFHIF